MKSWKELIIPRDDIVSPKFTEAMFTAALDDIIAQREKFALYKDPETFFDNTHVTGGLQKLIIQVFSALSGNQVGNNVIELKTTFGGGKTHSLIALYHLIKNLSLLRTHANLKQIGDKLELANSTNFTLACLIGSRENVSRKKYIKIGGVQKDVQTWWGDLAYQLAGEKGFKIIENNDRDKSKPDKATLHELFDAVDKPFLILMDEVVTYLVSLGGLDRHLYDETLQFLEFLMEVIGRRVNCAVVFTLPNSPVECINVEGEQVQKSLDKAIRKKQEDLSTDALQKAQRVSDRVTSQINPVEYEEIFEILRKRLFKLSPSPNFEAIRKNIGELLEQYKSWETKFLPDEIFKVANVKMSYEEMLKQAYPFHPSLIDVFYKEWGTLGNFQRTRAMLRIFAKILHYFWGSTEAREFIMPGDIPIEKDEAIRDELLKYLDPNFKNVIERDMERCKMMEQNISGDYQKWQVYSRLFHATFLHSVPVGGITKGASDKELLLNCVLPPMMPATFKDALTDLNENLYHFFQKGGSYYVHFEINLNAMIADVSERISADDVEDFLRKRMREISPAAHGVVIWPDDSKDIPDKLAKSSLLGIVYVACSPSLLTKKMTMEASTAVKLQEWVTMRGATPRINKNGLFFALMDKGKVDDLQKNTRRYLAMMTIHEDIQKGKTQVQLTSEQIVDLIKRIYELLPDSKLKTVLKQYDSKETLPVNEKGKVISLLRDAYSFVAHWTGKAMEQHEINSDKEDLSSRVAETLSDQGIIMPQMAPGYVTQLVSSITTVETFWNHFFQVLKEVLPAKETVLQDALKAAVEGRKLAYAIFQKGTPDPTSHKPEDFPAWYYGTKLKDDDIKISQYAWLIPVEFADKIVANGATPPEAPELQDIPPLSPYVNMLTLQWSTIPKADVYCLFRDVNPLREVKSLTPIYRGPGTQFGDTLPNPGVYYYMVIASNAFGDSRPSVVKNVPYTTSISPLTPVLHAISSQPIESPKFTLQWDPAKGAEKYALFQSSEVVRTKISLSPIYVGAETKYACSLPSQGTYYFAVIAINQYGESFLSNCEGVTFGRESPPIAPILKFELNDDNKSTKLSWNEVSGANQYHLYRNNKEIRNKTTQIKDVFAGKEQTFTDMPAQLGVYYYAVTAENEYGESVFSNCVSITFGLAENAVKLKIGLKPDYLDAFPETLGEFINDLIRIGANPSISITIQAQIPGNVAKIAQKGLKKKFDDVMSNSSAFTLPEETKWDI